MIDQIFQAAQVSGVTNRLGSEWIGTNDAPPSIIWVPKEATLEPGQKVTQRSGTEPRAIATCGITTTVQLWAVWPAGTPFPTGYDQSVSDFQALWELLRKFLVRLREVAPGAYGLGQVRFLTEEGEALVEYGKALEVDVTWSVPITANPRTTVTVTNPANLTMEGTMDLATDEVGIPAP